MMKKLLLLVCIFVLSLAALSAGEQDTGTLQIHEIALRAQAEDPAVRRAFRAVENAAENLIGESLLMSSSAKLQTDYGTTQNQNGSGGKEASAGLSINVPIIEQLSLGAALTARQNQGLEGDLSVSANPFTPGASSYKEQENYDMALSSWQNILRETYYEAEKAVLQVLAGELEYELSELNYALEQKFYEMILQEIALGEDSYEELQERLGTMTTARKNLYSTESQLLSSEKTLRLLFDPDSSIIKPESLSLTQLEDMIDDRQEEIAALSTSEPSSNSLESLKIELTALQTELDETAQWRPNLNLSGSIGYSDFFTWSVSASLSFSPDDIKDDEWDDLQEAIDEKLIDIRSEEFDLSLQNQLIEQNIIIAEQALEAAKMAEEQAALTLEESTLLNDHGELTIYELEQAQLSLRSAEIDSFSAAAGLYMAQAELLILYSFSE
jgi:hypothetical protein